MKALAVSIIVLAIVALVIGWRATETHRRTCTTTHDSIFGTSSVCG